MEIEKEIELINERNRKVELDKAWETSAFRVIFIVVTTHPISAIRKDILGGEGV